METLGNLAHQGLGYAEVALCINRVAVGLFFAFSGYHKLFNRARHERFTRGLSALGIPFLRFNQWWVPANEFLAGAAVALGLFAPLATIPLFVICFIACYTDTCEKVEAMHPIDLADRVDDWLYTPEALYIVSLTVVVLAGPGAWALSNLFS